MKIFTLSLPVLLLAIPSITIAQVEDVDLTGFRNPEYTYKSASLGTNVKSESESKGVEDGEKNSNLDLAGSFSLNLHFERNTASYQGYADILSSFSGSYGLSSENDGSFKSSTGLFSSVIDVSHRNYFYRDPKNFTAFHVYYRPSISRYSFEGTRNDAANNPFSEEIQKSNWQSADLSFLIGIGKGRLENIREVAQAGFLLKEMQEQGLLREDLGQEEVYKVGTKLTQINQTRFFDNRIQRIEKMQEIASLMESENMAGQQDALFYATLMDQLFFANTATRYNGKRYTVGLKPGIEGGFGSDYSKLINYPQNTVDESKEKNQSLTPSIALINSLENYKPISLYWQRYYFATVELGVVDFKNPQSYSSAGFEYGLGFYPNTRTTIAGSAKINYNANTYLDGSPLKHSLNSGLNINANYYLSPQVRLSAGGSLYYHINEVSTEYMNGNLNSLLYGGIVFYPF